MGRIGADRNLVGLVMTQVSAFGRDRGGTLPVLREMGDGRWETVEAATLDLRGARVSSARIRELVSAGRIFSAERLLGRPFSLVGDVVHGEQRGRDLGFPTANLHFADPVALPPDGIFAARASWGGGALLEPTERAQAVVSLGTQPTFGGRVRLFEVHLLDRTVDLYGQRLRVELCRRLRGQIRYDNADDLIAQMRSDVERAREVLASGQVR
jgi:riboflavin kinase/FMN adenylyltransferase